LQSEKLYHQTKDKLEESEEENKYIVKLEKARRIELVKEMSLQCEEFMKGLQAKYYKEIPDRSTLLEENDMLRRKFEDFVKNTTEIKDNLESQMKLKDKQTAAFEQEFVVQTKQKMEELVKF